MHRGAVVAALLLGSAVLAGCGSSAVMTGAAAADPYAGPMRATQSFRDRASVMERSGAAGLALECDGAAYRGGGGDYQDGLESAQGDAVNALVDWLDQEGWELPGTGYQVERDTGDRVLFSYDADGRTKIAMIAADGIRDFDDHVGWGIESWAQCDPAELPPAVTDALGIGVWQDAWGRRMPVTQVVSFEGPEHCGWDDITFLTIAESGHSIEYVRDANHELNQQLRAAFDAHSSLPKAAVDTGLQRDGRELWLGPGDEAAYLVSLSIPGDVEKWPAAMEPILCA